MSFFRKAFVLVIVLFVSLMMTSCATVGFSGWSNDLIIRGAESNPNILPEGQLLSVTKQVENPEYLTIPAWNQVRAVMTLLDSCKAHTDINLDEKYALIDYLFKDLPLNVETGVVRHVFLGGYFTGGMALEVRVGVFPTGPDAAADMLIVLMTNIVKTRDGKSEGLNKDFGLILGMDQNVTVLFGLMDGVLVDIQRVEPEDGWDYTALDGAEPISQIMSIQSYLADQNLQNDEYAFRLLPAIIDDEEQMPAIRIMAMLKLYDYYLQQEDLDSAEALWDSIIAFSPEVPGDMTPENLDVMNGASMHLLRRLLEN